MCSSWRFAFFSHKNRKIDKHRMIFLLYTLLYISLYSNQERIYAYWAHLLKRRYRFRINSNILWNARFVRVLCEIVITMERIVNMAINKIKQLHARYRKWIPISIMNHISRKISYYQCDMRKISTILQQYSLIFLINLCK